MRYLLALLVLVLQLWAAAQVTEAQVVPLNGLKLHYYNSTCRYVEEFVKHMVNITWQVDPSITPALIRLVYSDCLVTGCDASVLLEGEGSERAAPQNAGLRGFDVINRIKIVLESRCPGVVSCSDILHLATKEAVALAGAPKYPVFTGRRDGMSSTAASVDLPNPTMSWNQSLSYFVSKGLNVLDLGTLLGAHTTGKTHCRYIRDRLYDYRGSGQPDPAMDPALLQQLRRKCPLNAEPGKPDPVVFMNQASSNYSFSNTYYKQIIRHRAVMGIDQQMLESSDGMRIARQFADTFEDFRRFFALTISKMGSLRVLTGSQGEIRRNCSFTNAQLHGMK